MSATQSWSGLVGRELAAHEVGGGRRLHAAGAALAAGGLRGDAGDAQLAHQAGDALLADADARVVGELGLDARRAVDAAAGLVDRLMRSARAASAKDLADGLLRFQAW